MCTQLPFLLQLTEIYLGNNYVSCGSGVTALSSFLQTNGTLKVLHINDNVLTDVGCTAIAFALAGNTTLKALNMYADCPFDMTQCSPHNSPVMAIGSRTMELPRSRLPYNQTVVDWLGCQWCCRCYGVMPQRCGHF